MVSCSLSMLMELFEILYQVMYALAIKELFPSQHCIYIQQSCKTYLSDDLRRLSGVNGADILHHGSVKVCFLV